MARVPNTSLLHIDAIEFNNYSAAWPPEFNRGI
jgi:hypothetical protein